MNKQFFIGAAVAAVVVVAGLAAYGTTLDDDDGNIQRQNDAAEVNGGLGSGSRGETEVFDLRAGDCLTGSFGDEAKYDETADVVECESSQSEYMVTGLFTVVRSGAYPSDAETYFDDQAVLNCDESFTAWYAPSPESWEAGDRTVTCIEDLQVASSSSDETDIFELVVGDCLPNTFDNTPDEVESADVVPCEDARAASVVMKLVRVERRGGAFPGDAYFGEQSDLYCEASETGFYYAPTEGSWDLGDRTVTCIEEL